MEGGCDHEGEISTYDHSARRCVAFAQVHLELPPSGRWSEGLCRFVRGDGGEMSVACAGLSAISAGGARFPVRVTAGSESYGPFDAEGVTVAFPPGADAFVFHRNGEGFWDGWTLTRGLRGLVVSPFSCDPI